MVLNKNPMRVNDRMDWYQEAKFGMFIHWGVYSVAEVEASWPIMAPDLSEAMFANHTRINEKEYASLPARFNPNGFDADAWVQMAKEAGMRYMVITSKHHDGFVCSMHLGLITRSQIPLMGKTSAWNWPRPVPDRICLWVFTIRHRI